MNLDILDSSIGIVAKRKAGKSELVKYILHHYNKMFSKILIISGTEHINGFYRKLNFVDPKYIYNSYDEALVNGILTKMANINRNKTKKDSEFKHILLLLDDVCSSFNTHSSKSFEKLFTTGRHYGITTIVVQQYVNHIPPVARSNCDYILASQTNTQGLEILSTEYLFGNIDKKQFKQMFMKNTSDYGFLLISANCASDNNNLNEIYGQIKVPTEFINAK